jgi:hypothetical protein
MRPRNRYVLAAAAVLLLCRTAAGPADAKVVRDPKAASNPGVQMGGLPLLPQPPPPIPYSFIGAIASNGEWLMQCALWPWRQFGTMAWFRHHGPHDGGRLPRRISRVRR